MDLQVQLSDDIQVMCHVDKDDTIEYLLHKIVDEYQITKSHMLHVFYGSTLLKKTSTLASYGIHDKSCIFVMMPKYVLHAITQECDLKTC